jgi:hypothetical protein
MAVSVPTPLPTTVSTRPSPVAGLLDPAPVNCPRLAPLQTLAVRDFGGGFSGDVTFQGASPAWELGLPINDGTLHLNEQGVVSFPSTKVMWVVGPNYEKAVVLVGHEVRTGKSLWFQVYPSNSVPTSNPDADSTFTTRAVLDPAAPNRGGATNGTGHWNIWGIGIGVLTAGCYELDVSWPEGSWHALFAAGR